MSDWKNAPWPWRRLGPTDWLRVGLRLPVLGVVVYGGLLLLLILRLIERPLFGMARPVTPWITLAVCRVSLWVIGLRLQVTGQPMRHRGAVVANHASWLDIFVLNAVQRIYFVAKAEVEGWAFIGWLARATGTVFIARKGTEAKVQQALFEARLRADHRLLFFPEGTSTDSIRVLPFKSTLFQAFYTHGMEHVMHIQPVSLVYHSPAGLDGRFYGWWGDMDFARHMVQVLALPRRGLAEVIFHPEVAVDAFADRKALAAHCEAAVRSGHPLALATASAQGGDKRL